MNKSIYNIRNHEAKTMGNCSAKEYYSILFYDKRFLQLNRNRNPIQLLVNEQQDYI